MPKKASGQLNKEASRPLNRDAFLPLTRKDMENRGITQPDFVYVIGDAYVDHPSFGPAILSRLLERHGFTVCMIAQPDWKDPESVTTFGEPRLGFLVSAGNMDSMVNHYSVSKKHRQTDAYSPGGVMGLRPDRASSRASACASPTAGRWRASKRRRTCGRSRPPARRP